MSNQIKRFIGVSYVAMALILSAYTSFRACHLEENTPRNTHQLDSEVDATACVYQRVSGLEGSAQGTNSQGTNSRGTNSRGTNSRGTNSHGHRSNTQTLTPAQAAAIIQKARLQAFQPNCAILWSATWCVHCKKMASTVESLRQQGYAVYILDIDENEALAKSMKIRTLPTVIVWEQRVEIVRFRGVATEEQIKKHLKYNTPPGYEIY